VANTETITITPINDTPLSDVASGLSSLGPKRVEGKEFKAEQFDPLAVQKLLERNTTKHPTFATMAKVQVTPRNRRCSCD